MNKKEIDKLVDDLKASNDKLKIKLKKTLESNNALRKLKDDQTEQIERLRRDNGHLKSDLHLYQQSESRLINLFDGKKSEVEDLKENIVRLKEILSAIGIIYETYKK